MQTIHGHWNDDPSAVTLIDAHHHLWDLSRGRHPWLSGPVEPHFFLGDYSPLKRDYMPEDYRRDAANHNVLMTVHCEAEWDRDDQVGETQWLSDLAKTNAGLPGAIVGHAWFHRPNSEEIIARQASFPMVRGIRSKPVTSLTPDRKPDRVEGTMQDPAWLKGFALLEKYGLSWDLRVPMWHLLEAADVAQQFPKTPIVLNHTGFPWDRSEEGLTAWRKAMEAIARCPNVHLKVSEFGLRDQPWDYAANRRIVRDAIAIFGIERCLFASNFPVAGLRVEYDTLVRAVRRMIEDFSADDQACFFWKNAAVFYRLKELGEIS
ncbi:MAG: amidohydrolase family protein [Alphaproteobacteria bacterium]|nr:amidohydrolase family protein [Alphaproteobacteria bacterium]MCW5741885.1 amidohydrolase family protein [Alphaproteobacteria bacterium]